MDDKNQTIFGLPVVVSNEIPEGTAIMGRWPTPEEIREHGGFEEAIDAQKREWAMVTNIQK